MPEADGPLSILGRKLLRLCPPSLSALIGQLEGVEDYSYFVNLVREFVPERERDILSELTPEGQLVAFADAFGHRYFPIEQLYCESCNDITRGIPVIVMGMSYDDYHMIASDSRPGIQLMTYLVEDPNQEQDTRIALAEACTESVPIALLEKVPEGGLSVNRCQELLAKTKYQALIHWAKIVCNDTGNFFLDGCGEDLFSGYWDLPQWTRQEVEGLTQEWQQAEVVQTEITKLADWLEEDPPARFEEILSFITGEKNVSKEQLHLPLVFT